MSADPTDLRAGPGALRTLRHGQRMFHGGDWVKAGLAFALGPAVIGGVLVLLLSMPHLFADGGVAAAPAVVRWGLDLGLKLIWAPFLTLLGAPLVLGVAAILMRVG
ncbi:MAG: hypothetical protein AAFY65_17070 [Pseudomonadota bacterium]